MGGERLTAQLSGFLSRLRQYGTNWDQSARTSLLKFSGVPISARGTSLVSR